MSSWSLSPLALGIALLGGYLYRQYDRTHNGVHAGDVHRLLREYLVRDARSLERNTRPIVWIHLPYERNARHWSSFGARSSTDLNQPYALLCLRSIVERCRDTCTVCLIDDHSFAKLLDAPPPGLEYVHPMDAHTRQCHLVRLVEKYGGLVCPWTFVCVRDLAPLVPTSHVLVGETHALSFFGAPKGHPTITALREAMVAQRRHWTSPSPFEQDWSMWCREKGAQTLSAYQYGAKRADGRPVLVQDLMSNQPLLLYKEAYGLYVPADELLRRTAYAWFVRLSKEQALSSNTALGQWLVRAISEPYDPSFWKIEG